MPMTAPRVLYDSRSTHPIEPDLAGLATRARTPSPIDVAVLGGVVLFAGPTPLAPPLETAHPSAAVRGPARP